MRNLILTILLIAACDRGGSSGETVTWQPLKVGDRATHHRSTQLRLELTAPGEATPTAVGQTHDETRDIEVLAVAGGHVTRVKVRYLAARGRDTLDGEGLDETEPYAGKTYVVSVEDGATRVAGEGGEVVPEAERAAVAADVGDELGRMPGIAQVVTARAWTKGTKVSLPGPELAKLAVGRGGPVARSGTLTLTDVTAGIATFVAELETESDDLRMPQTITFRVEARTGRLAEATVAGTLEGTIDGARATGTTTASIKASWR